MDASDTLARPYLRLIPEEFSREIALLYLIIALCIESAQMPPACAASNLLALPTICLESQAIKVAVKGPLFKNCEANRGLWT